MRTIKISPTFGLISQIIMIVFLLMPLNLSYAKAGCCAHHGGVAGCDAATGRLRCKDGTISPSCGCEGNTVVPVKPPKKAGRKSSNETYTRAAPTIVPVDKTKTKGCCARHGGVAGCNTKTGYLMCKDGTQSSTCKCP